MTRGPGDDLAGLEAGLDALDTRPPATEPLPLRLRRSLVPPAIAAGIVLVAWWALAASGVRPPELLPPPGAVGDALAGSAADGTLPRALAASLTHAVVGFLASVVGGTLLGIALSQWRSLRTAVGPVVSGMQSLPSVTWVPAAVLWFGVGDAALYAVVLAGAIPSIALGLVSGIDRVPPLYRRVGRVLGAGPVAALRFVVLPAALPGYVAGLRQGWAFAWRSLMAAELIVAVAGSPASLGQLLDAGRRSEDMALILAVIGVILAIGITVEVAVFAPLERRLLRARGLGANAA